MPGNLEFDEDSFLNQKINKNRRKVTKNLFSTKNDDLVDFNLDLLENSNKKE